MQKVARVSIETKCICLQEQCVLTTGLRRDCVWPLLLSQASTQDLQPEEDKGLTLNSGVPEGIWKRCTGPMFLDFPWTVFSVARL